MTEPYPYPGAGATRATHTLAVDDPRISHVRDQLVTTAGAQQLGDAAFAWEHATLVEYEASIQGQERDQMIIVPGHEQHQTPLERLMLMAPYRPSDDQVRGVGFQLYQRDNEQSTEQFRLQFVDPSRRPIVGMAIDETQNQAERIDHPRPDLMQPQAAGGYWACVGNCLQNSWSELPWPIALLCGGGCGACVFGGNWYACPACAACLGGYAGGCLGACAAAT